MSHEEYVRQNIRSIVSCYDKALRQLVEGSVIRVKQGDSNHERCRVPTRKDFLLDYENWEVKKAYHFLKGTDGVSRIYEGRLYGYEIDGFEESDIMANNRYAIQCKDGYIKVIRHLNGPIRILKNIARRLLVHM